MTTERWEPDRSTKPNAWPMPPLATALGRGLLGRCPACGKGRIFDGFLKVVEVCSNCGAPLGLARADDAPPYFTILLVGHIVIPLLFFVDRLALPIWMMSAIFVPLTFALALGLIQPIKGATVGLMLNLNMLKSDPTAI
jgi:uncharacterized protein (DUF983 family)